MKFFLPLSLFTSPVAISLAKSLAAIESPIDAPSSTGQSVILLLKSQNALRNNPRLRRKKVLVHGAQGQLFYAERLVAPNEGPNLLSPPAPKPAPAKKPKPQLPTPQQAGQLSLLDWSNSEKPKFEVKPKQKTGDAGTLTLPFDSTSEIPSNSQGIHEPNPDPDQSASQKDPTGGTIPAGNGDNPGRNGQDAASTGAGPVRDGVRANLDAVRAGDGGRVDQGRDAGQPGAPGAGSDGGGDRHAGEPGTDAPRSDARRDNQAPATTPQSGVKPAASPEAASPKTEPGETALRETGIEKPRPVPGAFMARTSKSMQATVQKLAKKHGVDLSQTGAHLRLEQKNYDPLVVENIGDDRVSVAHYYTQHGDLMADPEIVFYTRGGVDGATWAPIEITQAPLGRHVSYARDTPHGIHIPQSRGQADLASFSAMWARNIKSQDWLERGARPQPEGEEANAQPAQEPVQEPTHAQNLDLFAAPASGGPSAGSGAVEDGHDRISVEDAHHYENGKRVRGERLDDDVVESQHVAAPEAPSPAPQTFEGDQTAPAREAGIGQSAPDGEIYAASEPLHEETPAQLETAKTVRKIVARGLSQEQKNEADLVLTEEDGIGKGSLGQKAKDNFNALDLLKTLEVEDRAPTEGEKRTLARYVGWGAFGQAFQDVFKEFEDKEWEEIPDYTRTYRFSGSDKSHFALYKQLRAGLNEEEFASARASIKNAHFTAPSVVKAMWDGLEQMGFTGGRVLEPSCGSGNFFGFMPEHLAQRSKRVGVELDQVTGRIARLLYPGAQIHIKGFEEAPLSDDSFDVAIGNVPFGDYGVVDHEYARSGRKYQTARIHNYFFSKALDKVRPGGIVAFVTSAGTLDAKTSKNVREAWEGKANFLGAIRLPNTAFEENAGTKVTTDIIYLQKKDPVFESLHPRDAMGRFIKKWTDTKVVEVPSEDQLDTPGAHLAKVPINEYFVEHPEMMLGRLAIGAGLYRADQVGLVSDGRDITGALKEATEAMISQLPFEVFHKQEKEAEIAQSAADEARLALDNVKPGAFYVEGDTIFVNRSGRLIPLEADPGGKDKKKRERIKAQYTLLEVAREHLAGEIGDYSDAELAESRADLNRAYDAFVKEHGDLHSRANASAFASDPDAGLLLALEHRDKETGAISKADIFRKRTITPYRQAQSAQNATDALGITLGETGELDWQRLSALLDRDPESIRDELAASGLIFRDPSLEDDPVTAGWLPADAYLSGEVKKKLEIARSVAEVDATYAPNVAALEAVQPEALLPSQVEARLGAPWVPEKHVNAFLGHLLGRGSTENPISFSKHTGWSIASLDKWDARRDNAAATSTWGTKDMHALKILEATLNMTQATVTKPHPDDDKKRVVDPQATLAAREKQQAIKNEWRRWLDTDTQRAQELTDLYNDLFNTTAPRQFDGSHLTFPGMSAGFQVGFRAHAKAAVWRAIQTGNCLFDHVVGAGKTGCIAATAMELRRLNLAKKPMVVCRNPQLEQWEREFREIYPNAKLLVINEGMGNAQKRKELTSKIATGDWDAVLIAQSTFKEIPASPQLYANFIGDQLEELREALNEEKAKALESGSEKKRDKAQKQIESAIAKLEVKLKSHQNDIAEHQDDSLNFDDLGVDALLVDEAHDYKNLMFTTRMGRIAGLNNSASEKAMDMFVKSQEMLRKNKGRGLIFATGTPVSNTLSEMWTMKRYLMMPKMKELGFDRFDSWAATFGDTTTSVEKAPEGGFRSRTRFAKFVNVPEMVGLYRQVADVKTRDDLKAILPTPKLEGGEPTINSAPASPTLRAYMETLQERAKELQKGTVDPKEDNFLKITSDGRKAALDMRLVDPAAPDDPHSKVNLCVNNVARLHRESADRKATQLVFLDLGTPQGEKKAQGKLALETDGETGEGVDEQEALQADSVYGDIKRKLIAQGVPEREIAFAHDFDSPAKRSEMSRRMETGDLRVLIGSTMKMGVGLNVQKRLFANHHLDCPWKPGELEQRDGRILRQGNLHHESEWNVPVQIHRYGTQNSFDEYMWQAVAKKAAFIAQTRQGQCARTCEDMDDTVMTAASMQAALSDNPLMGEKAQVDSDVYRLTALRKSHLDGRISVQRRLAALPAQKAHQETFAADREAAAKHYESNRAEKFAMTVHGQTYSDREQAGNALATAYNRVAFEVNGAPHGVKVGEYNGFDIYARLAPSGWDEFDPQMANVAYEMRTPGGQGAQFLQVGSSGAGTTTKIDNALKGLATEAAQARAAAQNHDKQMAEYAAIVNKPFEHQEDLDRAFKRQQEIEAELSKGGDADTAVNEGGEAKPEEPLQKSLRAMPFPAPAPVATPIESAEHPLAKALCAFRARTRPVAPALVEAAQAFSRAWNEV